ncbi:MAG: AraC family transcriptional regulator [marine bacterium B5-7]|nr:MAG: AraC family transcriptional regulator [marine bacterium B5-7]
MSEMHISLLAIPEADVSSLTGMYTVLNLFNTVVPSSVNFRAEIVAPDSLSDHGSTDNRYMINSLGLPTLVQHGLSNAEHTDGVIIPSLFTDAEGEWYVGRYPQVVEWIRELYARDKLICASCTGALLLAETGLLDGREATQHWAFESTFRRNFPKVKLNTTKVLVTTGDDECIVMSGASAAWHDLILYLICRYAGPAAARTIAKFFLLQWHEDGQAPYILFQENTRHQDTIILDAQNWLRQHHHQTNPVESVVQRSELSERSFNRRFQNATGYTTIRYVQNLRIEDAKSHLETTSLSIDEIAWKVGYQDPSFFRRVFKRITGITPSAYRRKFCVIGVKILDSCP